MAEGPDLLVYTDGACRGNPGPSSGGVVIFDGQGREIVTFGKFFGEGTNNQAEYKAVIEALVASMGFTQGWVALHSDSEVVVRQLNGEYALKDARLAELNARVREAAKAFARVTFANLPREHGWIRLADRLANRVLDQSIGR